MRKITIAVGLCAFLTIAPILGTFVNNEKAGEYIGNLTPYIHLGISITGGIPFGDVLGGLLGLFVIGLGVTGFTGYYFSGFRDGIVLRLLLYLTIVYCGTRVLAVILLGADDLQEYDGSTLLLGVAVLIVDIAWAVFCYWAIRVMKIEEQNLKSSSSNN